MPVRSRRMLGILLAFGLQSAASLGAERPNAGAGARGEARPYELLCGQSLTVWRKARDPGTRECCALALRARAGLWSATTRSRPLAQRALALCPHGLEAAMSVAATDLAAGDSESAHRLFQRVSSGESASAFARLPPGDILLAARAASLAGEAERALEHYRALILELDQVPSPHERARVLLEAALLAARGSPPAEAEAFAYLRQSADHLAPRLSAVRLLVGHAIAPGSPDEAPGEALMLTEARELLIWMLGDAPAPRGAPGELLPVVRPELLLELLPPSPRVNAEEP